MSRALRALLAPALSGALLLGAGAASANDRQQTTFCPPGSDNSTYCERGSAQGSADSAADALAKAVLTLSEHSAAVHLDFTPSVGGLVAVTVRFTYPLPPSLHDGAGHDRLVTVASETASISAGVPLNVSVPLRSVGREILAFASTHHAPIVAVIDVTVTEAGSPHVGHATEAVIIASGPGR